MTEATDLLTPAQIAERYRRSKRHVAERYCYEPDWPEPVWIGQARYYRADEVDAWFKKRSGPQFRLQRGCSTQATG